jgi:hypothetical protein
VQFCEPEDLGTLNSVLGTVDLTKNIASTSNMMVGMIEKMKAKVPKLAPILDMPLVNESE